MTKGYDSPEFKNPFFGISASWVKCDTLQPRRRDRPTKRCEPNDVPCSPTHVIGQQPCVVPTTGICVEDSASSPAAVSGQRGRITW